MSATQSSEQLPNLPREIKNHILSFIDIPVELWDMSNPDRKQEIAINRAALKAYGQTSRDCAEDAQKRLLATVVLDMKPSRTITQLKQDLDDFADLLEASISFKPLGMACHIQSFTIHISTSDAAQLFLEDGRIRRILRLLLPDQNNGIIGLEFFGIFARTAVNYKKVSSETAAIIQQIMNSNRMAHIMLRGLEDLPDQLFDELRNQGKNLEMYECSTTAQRNPESIGWGDHYQHCYFEARGPDFKLPPSIEAVQGPATTLRTLRIHLPAVKRKDPRSNSQPALPEIPLQQLPNLTSLHLTQRSALSLDSEQVFFQFVSCLSRMTVPPSLTALKIETVAAIVLVWGPFYKHLSMDLLNKLDTILAEPCFHRIVDVTIGIKCHVFDMDAGSPPVSEARRRQIHARIKDDMEAGLPLLIQADPSVRRHCFDISVEDATAYALGSRMEYAPIKAGGRKDLVVPFFEPDPGFWEYA